MITGSRTSLIRTGLLATSLDSSGMCWSQNSGGPKPGPQIQDLTRALSGHWSLSVTWEPDEATPKGSVNTGEERWRPGPG